MSGYEKYDDDEAALVHTTAYSDSQELTSLHHHDGGGDRGSSSFGAGAAQDATVRPSLAKLLSDSAADVPPSASYYETLVSGGVGVIVKKFGTFNGVFVRCLVSIYGVSLFLLNHFCVGQAGWGLMLVILLISSFATIVTTFSASALCTNGKVLGGGPYYLVSRSLGIEFGAALGIIFFLAQAIAVALNTVGFATAIVDVIPGNITPGGTWDVAVLALISNVLCFVCCLFGVSWLNKVNLVLLILVFFAFMAVLIGIWSHHPGYIHGFTGLSNQSLRDNFGPHFTDGYSFFKVAAVFFPSVTGILAGATVSGELRDPARSVPVGTLSAIGASCVTYIIQFFFVAACATSAALSTNVNFLVQISIWTPLVIAGIFSASISSALGLLMGAPRILVATIKDKMFPFLEFFAKTDKKGDPIYGYVLTLFIACLFSIAGDLNFIAAIVTNMYLLVYTIINYACFAASFSRSPGWRPGFRYYNMWVALAGSLFCVVLMFFMDYISAIIIVGLGVVSYKYAEYRAGKAGVRLGGAGEAWLYRQTVKTLRQLQTDTSDSIKTYRPQLFIVENNVSPDDMDAYIRLVAYFYKSRALIMRGRVYLGDPIDQELRATITRQREKELLHLSWKHDIIFGTHAIAPSIRTGLTYMLQNSGVGKVRPNVVVFHMPPSSAVPSGDNTVSPQRLFVQCVRDALQSGFAVSVIANSAVLTSDAAGWFPKQKFMGDIQVHWLADDGGLTALLPYLLHESSFWKKTSKLAYFVPLEQEDASSQMARLLAVMRVEGSTNPLSRSVAPSTEVPLAYRSHPFAFYAASVKTNASHGGMAFVSLPVPNMEAASDDKAAEDYCQFLRVLSSARVATVFVRGSQQNVLTPYL
eukprot:ANDGO_04628.mRNA.1 Bumetanide-sensitive sodium-(potassium)-chloride cotransporter